MKQSFICINISKNFLGSLALFPILKQDSPYASRETEKHNVHSGPVMDEKVELELYFHSSLTVITWTERGYI